MTNRENRQIKLEEAAARAAKQAGTPSEIALRKVASVLATLPEDL